MNSSLSLVESLTALHWIENTFLRRHSAAIEELKPNLRWRLELVFGTIDALLR